MTIDLFVTMLLVNCVNQGNDDDKGVHPSHRNEPDVKDVGHSFPHANDG